MAGPVAELGTVDGLAGVDFDTFATLDPRADGLAEGENGWAMRT